MNRRTIFSSVAILICLEGMAQGIAIPELENGYPRMEAEMEGRRTDSRLELYVERHQNDPEWIVSRLQMYWDSHATDIYVAGETLDHVGGRAPVPTVRYTATRGTETNYSRPRIEDWKPYQDSLGLWMINKSTGKAEWTDPRKTGRNVESMNMEVLKLARDAAYVYWKTSDEKYARFATDIFDTYLTGIYYRNVPYDLNHGHQQTLVGLTSFEVIHEDAVIPATQCYDFLHDRLVAENPSKIQVYDDAFRKWADTIISGGVPHNNWNLIQAQFILHIALVLGDDSTYGDGKGRQFYLNQILNESSIRQWSIGRLIDYGFDKETGLWKECPGYSTMVLSEFVSFVRLIDSALGIDLVEKYPVLAEAVKNAPQYMFPNGLIAGWGDTYYGPLRTDFFKGMADNATQYGKEDIYTAMAADIEAGNRDKLVTPTFLSEEVSWFAARTGMDPQNSLMISVAGSKGNHMHANGISMELYGKGYVMAPDLGRGSGYTSLDHTEFYSQFPAHNTVCVDGVSSYPTMMSHHGFKTVGCYPAPETTEDVYNGILYGDFSFLEPETQAEQRRQLIIMNTGSGYYVDIFRSRRQDGKDRMHDYFYHNIGQSFDLSVATEPTEELSFAGGHIGAYSYLWNKSAATTADDVEGRFTMSFKDGSSVGMKMWMRGDENRKVFKAYSPKIDALTRIPMPYDVRESPCHTFVARQYGEAWRRPFVTVYQPFASADTDSIASVRFSGTGYEVISVEQSGGSEEHIFSSDEPRAMEHGDIKVNAVIAAVAPDSYFMSEGTSAGDSHASISTKVPATAALEKREDGWYYTSTAQCKVKIGKKTYTLPASPAMSRL